MNGLCDLLCEKEGGTAGNVVTSLQGRRPTGAGSHLKNASVGYLYSEVLSICGLDEPRCEC